MGMIGARWSEKYSDAVPLILYVSTQKRDQSPSRYIQVWIREDRSFRGFSYLVKIVLDRKFPGPHRDSCLRFTHTTKRLVLSFNRPLPFWLGPGMLYFVSLVKMSSSTNSLVQVLGFSVHICVSGHYCYALPWPMSNVFCRHDFLKSAMAVHDPAWGWGRVGVKKQEVSLLSSPHQCGVTRWAEVATQKSCFVNRKNCVHGKRIFPVLKFILSVQPFKHTFHILYSVQPFYL